MKYFTLLLYCIGFFCITTTTAQEYGLAGMYDDKFHGRRTAYEVVYDKNKLTAAHKKHPAGTQLRVTRPDNNKSVIVVVTDKGPYTYGKIIQLSRAAAEALDMLSVGVAEVKVEVIGKKELTPANVTSRSADDVPQTNTSRRESSTSERPDENVRTYESTQPLKETQNEKTSTRSQTIQEEKQTDRKKEETTTTPATITPNTVIVSARSPIQGELEGKNYQKYGLHKVEITRPENTGYGVQVMALNSHEQVFSQIAEFQGRGFKELYLNIDPAQPTYPYKLIIGMYPEEVSAKRYSSDLRSRYNIKGFVTGSEYTNYFFKINLFKPEMQGYGVQVMSLASYENVLDQLADFNRRGFNDIYVNVEQGTGGSIYKIILGLFDNPDSANRYKNDLKRKYKVNGFTVDLTNRP